MVTQPIARRHSLRRPRSNSVASPTAALLAHQRSVVLDRDKPMRADGIACRAQRCSGRARRNRLPDAGPPCARHRAEQVRARRIGFSALTTASERGAAERAHALRDERVLSRAGNVASLRAARRDRERPPNRKRRFLAPCDASTSATADCSARMGHSQREGASTRQTAVDWRTPPTTRGGPTSCALRVRGCRR